MDKHIDESTPYLGQVWALSSRSFSEAAGELLKVFCMEGVCIIMWTISDAMSDFFGMDGQMEIQVDMTGFKISASRCCSFGPRIFFLHSVKLPLSTIIKIKIFRRGFGHYFKY